MRERSDVTISDHYGHVTYFRVIQNIADSRPKVRYLIAKDDSNNTLFEIVKVRTNRFEKN
jgi:hypothetical protein